MLCQSEGQDKRLQLTAVVRATELYSHPAASALANPNTVNDNALRHLLQDVLYVYLTLECPCTIC